MEKRLFVFIVCSLVIWGSFLTLQMFFAPPPEAKKPKPPAAEEVDPKKAEGTEKDKEKEESPEKPPKVEEKQPSETVEATDPAVASIPRQRIALGSLDPASGYPMLITFDNRGAAIERIELNGDYHELEDLSGYLGHLALTDISSGCQIGVVGPGTPAALAVGDDKSIGLQPDDVIISLNDKPTPDYKALRAVLKETKPKDVAKLIVERGAEKQKIAFEVTLIRQPLELIRPENNKGSSSVEPGKKLDLVSPPSYRLTLAQAGEARIKTFDDEIAGLPSFLNGNWEVTVGQDQVEFSKSLSAGELEKVKVPTSLKIVKRYRMPPPDGPIESRYHVELEVEIQNTGDKAEKVAYRLEGPNGLTTEGWWYLNKVHHGWGGAGARDVAFMVEGNYRTLYGNPEIISESTKQVKNSEPPRFDVFRGIPEERRLDYIGVDTQYFASALLPGDAMTEAAAGKQATFKVASAYAYPLNVIDDKKWAKTTNVSFQIDSVPVEIEAGQSHSEKFLIFAGPKIEDSLTYTGTVSRYGLSPLIEYGWFRWVAWPLMQLLRGLYSVTRNYGISIILLTVIVRMCLLPFSIRQAKSAAAMQAMAPEMAKIKEKFKDDTMKQGMAQRELMSKHGINPMSGCLLMFAQLPIFVGLYRCLSIDIDLREAALFPGLHWASNLAGPDQLFRWKEEVWPSIGDEAHGWFGPYFNVLPLFSVALFLYQQKLFAPPAVDEEQKIQQRMMFFMTFFMGIMFYKVPAGLCIYIITSSLWGIVERLLLPKPKPGDPLPEVSSSSKSPSPENPTPAKDAKPPQLPGFLTNLFNLADSELKESKSNRKREKKR